MNIKAKLSKIYDNYYNSRQSNRLYKFYNKGILEKSLNQFSIIDYQLIRNKDDILFNNIQNEIHQYCQNKLKNKIEANCKINIAFMVYSASMWSCDELYHYFENDNHFNPFIVVGRYFSDTDLSTFPFYNKTLNYFKNNNYNVKTIELSDTRKQIWKKLDYPDIIFYLTPYNIFLPKELNIGYAPASSLCIYIPYCYTLCDEGKLASTPGMLYSWKHFCESNIYQNILARAGLTNTEYLGYPRMDKFYEPIPSESFKWKMTNENAKKIIYAPHHSFSSNSSRFSTFRNNYKEIYDYAASHTDTTSWCLKLHPNLKRSAVDEQIFHTQKECEDFFTKWNSLPNATVVEESTYSDIFITSDAMLCDSVSFLAEYQHTNKPLLYLENESHIPFNEFGQQIYKILYSVDGKNIQGIFDFIDDVVINGNDTMYKQRKEFFDTTLNYRKNTNKSASLQIYEYINQFISQ